MNFCKNFSDHVISKILKYINVPDVKSIYMKDLNCEEKKIYLHCEKFVKDCIKYVIYEEVSMEPTTKRQYKMPINSLEEMIHEITKKIFATFSKIRYSIGGMIEEEDIDHQNDWFFKICNETVEIGNDTFSWEIMYPLTTPISHINYGHSDNYCVIQDTILKDFLNKFVFQEGMLKLKN
jgi:hypothetical protein